ncbi:MAG TPA: flavin reductase family protein [Trebonia sp.]|nr:flavin reductase family protein [Trebonia sp.]
MSAAPDEVRPGNGPGVGAETFRRAMASVCTPVSVVTAMAGDRPHGTTVSAFASLSLNPPMILVSLDKSSELLRHVRRTLIFGLNVLHTDQAALAAGFARKGDDKFNGISWMLERGVPRLDGCAAWLACSVERMVTGGDHTVVFGHVVSAAHAPASPLTYYQRRFGTHLAHRDGDEDQGAARPLQPGLRYLPGLPDEASSRPAFVADSLEELFAFS